MKIRLTTRTLKTALEWGQPVVWVQTSVIHSEGRENLATDSSAVSLSDSNESGYQIQLFTLSEVPGVYLGRSGQRKFQLTFL